jgi:hypothetical protein
MASIVPNRVMEGIGRVYLFAPNSPCPFHSLG